ncbi:MAG: cytochrome P450 [Aliidongia sp.]
MPAVLPFVGRAIAFNRNPVRLLEDGARRYGEVFSFPLFGKTVNALIGPRANEAFFRAGDDELGARDAYRFTVPIFGPGVAYDIEPERMDEQLRLVHPALRDDRMQLYARIMAEEADRYLDGWGDSGELDLLATFNELTIFIAGRCLLGEDFRGHLSAEFSDLYKALEGGINLIAFFNPYLPLPAMRRRDAARRRVVQLIGRVIAERQAKNKQSDDFLGTLMAARYRDGSVLNEEVIAGLMLTLLFAGQHTSAVLAAWTGLLLLQHPEHLARVRAEITTIGLSDPPRLAELKRLSYLECCIKEAERLHPPLVMLMRTVLKPIDCLGHRLPAGSLAMISPAVTHRLPGVFADPDRFDPDRFGAGREEDRRQPYSLIGFGGGKHRCIGLAFAQQQVKVIWTRILARYDLAAPKSVVQPDYTTFVVGPRPPCRISYRRRALEARAAMAASS